MYKYIRADTGFVRALFRRIALLRVFDASAQWLYRETDHIDHIYRHYTFTSNTIARRYEEAAVSVRPIAVRSTPPRCTRVTWADFRYTSGDGFTALQNSVTQCHAAASNATRNNVTPRQSAPKCYKQRHLTFDCQRSHFRNMNLKIT